MATTNKAVLGKLLKTLPAEMVIELVLPILIDYLAGTIDPATEAGKRTLKLLGYAERIARDVQAKAKPKTAKTPAKAAVKRRR